MQMFLMQMFWFNLQWNPNLTALCYEILTWGCLFHVKYSRGSEDLGVQPLLLLRLNCSCPCFSFRIEEVIVCDLLTVRSDFGHCCYEDTEDERTSICHLQGHQQWHKCSPFNARLSILWQTNGNHDIPCQFIQWLRRLYSMSNYTL